MEDISFYVDDKEVIIDVDPSTRLLDVLRIKLHITGVKEGCGEGACGACSVIVDGVCYDSCLTPVANVIGKHIITIEGFRNTPQYRIIADAFADFGASQCGFCTPGMIIASQSLLSHNPHPSDEEIRAGLAGNLCRCTGYQAIINAVKLASKIGGNLWDKK